MLTDEPHIRLKAKSVEWSLKAVKLKRLDTGHEFWVPKACSEWQGVGLWAISKWWADKEGIKA